MSTIIGIAGGSGSGKSTLAIMLVKKYPDLCTVVHLDDYFKKKENITASSTVIQEGALVNFEHPDSIDFESLYNDICTLRKSEAITIRTKSELYNPGYDDTLKNKILYTIEPKPIVIVEGYLALYDERIRALMDIKVYLDISIVESIKRRSANKFTVDTDYFEKVLLPTHTSYVEPTKQYADLVIDVLANDIAEAFAILEEKVIPIHN